MERKPNLWFMPWRWSRWTWAMLPLLMFMGYFLSAVPMLRLANHLGNLGSHFEIMRLVYRPIWIIDANYGAAYTIIDWEDRMVDQMLGKEELWLEQVPGYPVLHSSSQTVFCERVAHFLSRD